MAEKVRCNICDIDIYISGSLFVGKGKVPSEVEAHCAEQSHKDKRAALQASIADVPDGCMSVLATFGVE